MFKLYIEFKKKVKLKIHTSWYAEKLNNKIVRHPAEKFEGSTGYPACKYLVLDIQELFTMLNIGYSA